MRISPSLTAGGNLDVAVSTRAAKVDWSAALATALGSYTNARGVLLSNLDALISSRESRTPAATYFSVGRAVSQAAAALLFDSGQLVAGEYRLVLTCQCFHYATSACSDIVIQHRDAANTGNVRAFTIEAQTGGSGSDIGGPAVPIVWPRFTVATNERVRAYVGNGDAGASGHDWSCWLGTV